MPPIVYYSVETVVYINIRVQQEGMNRGVLLADLYGEASYSKSAQYALVNKEQDFV